MSKNDLTKIYNEGLTVEFDDDDKLVFISDVHRGDGTFFDSLLANRNIYLTALKYYLRNDYIYVEVGDGDELWKNHNFIEIACFYEEVYKIFNKYKKKDKIYMIYGNHDIIKKNPKFKCKEEKSIKKCGVNFGNEFIKFIKDIEYHEGINFMYRPVKEKFLVTHGNQLDISNCELSFISKFLVRYIWKFLYGIAGFKDPTSSAKSKTKKGIIDLRLQNWSRENATMILCGHTHNSYFPDLDEPPYFNDGCCVMPDSMTAIEIENGMISLVKWSVDAHESGVLWVKRKVLSGPEKLSSYLLWAKEERLRVNRLIEKENIEQRSKKWVN